MGRFLLMLGLLVAMLLPWLFSSDVVELIVRQKPVLLGRYSMGHMGILIVLTLFIGLSIAVLLFKQPRKRDYFASWLMIQITTFASIFVLVIASGFLNQPRYVEQTAEELLTDEQQAQLGFPLFGGVRHRPPNEVVDYVYTDKPEQARSYPNAPTGYGTVDIKLTTDAKGFRNQHQHAQYDWLVVGDSFAAGSHVSDEQAWTELLSEHLSQPIYNLGMSGTNPEVYLSNFVAIGRELKPKQVIMMIYEGNDFKSSDYADAIEAANGDMQEVYKNYLATANAELSEEEDSGLNIKRLAKASPITQGLKRLSQEKLEHINKSAPVPEYDQWLSWMPVAITAEQDTDYYSFAPDRMLYLYTKEERFAQSAKWLGVAQVIKHMQTLALRDDFKLLVVYAPSKPHVVLPLIEDQISAKQLHYFAQFKSDRIPDPETFKHSFYARVHNQENTFLNWCKQHQIDCLSTTAALTQATRSGVQTYFTYDQHWTPAGNQIAAQVVFDHLQAQRVSTNTGGGNK